MCLGVPTTNTLPVSIKLCMNTKPLEASLHSNYLIHYHQQYQPKTQVTF